MVRVKLTQEQLSSHLEEQIDFIRSSAALYDGGKTHEAKRIAIAVINIVYDRGKTKSLLSQLGMHDRNFYSSGITNRPHPLDDSKLTAYHPLIAVEMFPDGSARYLPMFDDMNGRSVKIGEWLNEIIFKYGGNVLISRLDLLRYMRDTDGGSHVDDEIGEDYYNLAVSKGLNVKNLKDGKDVAFEGAQLCAARQIGHEILRTFGDPPMDRRPAPKLYSTMMTGKEIIERSQLNSSKLRVIFPFEKIVESRYYYMSMMGPAGLSENSPCICGSGFQLKDCHARPVTKEMEETAMTAAENFKTTHSPKP